MKYRKLRKYKYQTKEDCFLQTEIIPEQNISTTFIDLSLNGFLKIKKGYSWDGASGPSIDTDTLCEVVLFTMLYINLCEKNTLIETLIENKLINY